MKHARVKLVVLLIALAFLYPAGLAGAKEKGVLIRWWERVTGRSVQAAPRPAAPPAEKKAEAWKPAAPAVPEAREETVAVEEEIQPAPGQEQEEEVAAAGEMTVTAPAEEPGAVEEKPAEEQPLEEQQAEEAPEKKEKPPKREIPISKEKMLEVIHNRLKVYSEIVYIVPELTFEEKEDGQKEYFYQTRQGSLVKLSDLDKETLYSVFVSVNNEATRINTERLIRQIQQQEQLRRSLQNIPQQPPQPPPQPPQPPQVFTPPRPPSPPPDAQRR